MLRCSFEGQRMSKLSRSSHALVTGGGRGIGRAVAAALTEVGATVTILGRNRATLDEAVKAGAAKFAEVADRPDEGSVRAPISVAPAKQPIDIPVAHAGAAGTAPL